MERHDDALVQIAIDELFQAHAASMKAHVHFMECQAKVLIKLDPDSSLEDFTKLVDMNFDKFIQNPRTDKVSDEEFEEAGIKKKYRPPPSFYTVSDSCDQPSFAEGFDTS